MNKEAYLKGYMHKEAIILPAAIGAGIGAVKSPKGKKAKGASQGAVMGITTEIGAGLGLAAGAVGAGAGTALLEHVLEGRTNMGPAKEKAVFAGMLALIAAGGIGGGMLGFKGGRGLARNYMASDKKLAWEGKKADKKDKA